MLSSASKSRHDGDLLAVVLIAPAAAVVIAAMLLPLVYAFTMSLFDFRPGFETQGKFLFLQIYLRFFQDKVALQSLLLTLVFTFSALLLELLLGVGFSILLLTVPVWVAKVLRGVYCIPLLISPIIVGLIWRYMYDPTFGLVYYVLSGFGLDSIFGGLEKPGWALFSVAIADIWETTPFVLIVASAVSPIFQRNCMKQPESMVRTPCTRS